MTSGVFTTIPVSSIIVDREGRQRRELTGIEELAKSILDNGLINPIVVTRDNVLIAGERRLTAHKYLGFDSITVQYAEDMDELSLHLLELEENVRREDLSWQDHVAAVARYHELQSKNSADWTQDKTADALNMDRSTVSKHLLVSQALDDQVPEVVDAPRFSVAHNFMQRKRERQQTTVLRELRDDPPLQVDSREISDESPAESSAPIRRADILRLDFLSWSQEIQTTPANLIHCDFPYGVNAGDTKGMSGYGAHGYYDDKPDVYFELLKTLTTRQDNFIAPSAHMMFWFSMDFYTVTVETLREAGWRVDPFPLIWYKSDNSGILPDPQRGPRRIYETALFCTRGDRKIVKPIANAFAHGITKKYHMSEKPAAMLSHFFRMLVDETTVLCDPTCGSGNAVTVAEEMGANFAFGLEKDEQFYKNALENLGLDMAL